MTPHSPWRIFISQILGDRELYASLMVAMVLLVGELATPASWTPGFQGVALLILILGLGLSLNRHYRTSILLHQKKPLPVVLAVEVARRDALRDLELAKEAITNRTTFDAFRKVESFFNVHYEDLLAQRTERLPPDPAVWHEFLEEASQQISQFRQHLAGGCEYHVFIHVPASLAFGLGATLGTRNPVVAYHYSDGKYQPVIDLTQDTRRIKAALPPQDLRYIKVRYPESLQAETAVVLNLASHAAGGGAVPYLADWEHPPAIVEVSNTYGGNLTVQDWVPVVQEVYQVFKTLQQDSRVRRIHLFHSIPVPLALGIGMALGPFVPVTVYNWERTEATYYPVLQLNQLESLSW
jgi:hypothetical protein